MSEFEKELESILEKIGEYYQGITTRNVLVISKHFKDWQPPKPLVIVPQFVAYFIEERKESLKLYGAFHEIDESYGTGTELYDWVFASIDSQELFARAWIDGYTVKKEQLYYLKHIDFCKTDKHYDWFTIKHSDGPLNHLRVEKGQKPSTIDCKFTQQEIDSMQTGSYEQIKVEP